jgi:PKHD-type hydroxylase
MNLKYKYWYFQKALSDKFCDEVVAYGNQQREEIGFVGNINNSNFKTLDKKTKKFFNKKRTSNVSWLDDPWIMKEVLPFVNEANKSAGWNFQLEGCETAQFTKYKINQFYDWHFDENIEPYKNGTIRKLSVTCSLSDPNDYEGGRLQFDYRDADKVSNKNFITCEEILPKGSIVVFPSFIWHRVMPVTKGTRYSLVIWNLGRPYI